MLSASTGSLRRVSSRPRLVSWDAFDATEDGYESARSSSNSSGVFTAQTSLPRVSSTHSLKRKRRANKNKKQKQSGKPSVLEQLGSDVMLHVLSFGDTPTVRAFGQTCSEARRLVLSADRLWWDLARRQWSFLEETPAQLPHHLSELMSMSCSKPSRVDPRSLGPCRRWISRNGSSPALNLITTDDGDSAVQFTGTIGQGDRCIRGNHPLPRPQMVDKQGLLLGRGQPRGGGVGALWTRLRRSPSPVKFRPLVAPFCGSNWNLSPRLVSYYEVSIREQTVTPLRRGSRSDCVAVGLALESFSFATRMPGWDDHSFGYHGDDGGIFHGKGHMIKHYGPSFGVGDTIGCGIDYAKRAIFYTLNGRFLGYAFEDLSRDVLTRNWYPVVGLDTNALIQLNFGTERRFLYDLEGMIAGQTGGNY